jgi:hypothetical protein
MEVSGQLRVAAALLPTETARATNWVGPRAGLDVVD